MLLAWYLKESKEAYYSLAQITSIYTNHLWTNVTNSAILQRTFLGVSPIENNETCFRVGLFKISPLEKKKKRSLMPCKSLQQWIDFIMTVGGFLCLVQKIHNVLANVTQITRTSFGVESFGK